MSIKILRYSYTQKESLACLTMSKSEATDKLPCRLQRVVKPTLPKGIYSKLLLSPMDPFD